MSEAIAIALIGLAGSAIGSICGILISNKLMQYRLEQLEKKVEKHNNLVERMYGVEKKALEIEDKLMTHEKLYEEKIKVANHRLEDLEHSHESER